MGRRDTSTGYAHAGAARSARRRSPTVRIVPAPLETELGVEPSPETQALLARIQDGTLPQEPDPELASPYKGLHAFGVTDAADYWAVSQ